MKYGIVEIDEIKNERNKVIIYILLTLFAVGCLIYTFTALRVETVSVVGNKYYSEEEVKSWVINSPSKEYVLLLWLSEKLSGHEDIPFVDRYSVKITGTNSVKVTVYEKDIIACFEQMGTYMFFNSSGKLLECGSEKIDSVPEVTGIAYDSAVLYEEIDVKNKEIFEEISSIVQALDRNDITVDRIHFETSGAAILYIGDISVMLGRNSDMNGQIVELVNILPKLAGQAGVLDMTYYVAGQENRYPFTIKKN